MAEASGDDDIWSIQLAHTSNRLSIGTHVAQTLDTNGSLAIAIPDVAATLTAGGTTAGRRREDDSNLVVDVGTPDADDAGGESDANFNAAAFTQNQRNEVRWVGGDGQQTGTLSARLGTKQQTYLLSNSFLNVGDDLAPTLQAQSSDRDCLVTSHAARRLLPAEVERLQGIPSDWTRWGIDGCELSEAARYRICGNGVAVPVVTWIAQRMARAMAGEAIHP